MDADKKRIWIRGQFVEVTDEVYRAYMQGDRKMRYFENDLKTERFVLGKEGQVVQIIPSREDSLDRLVDENAQQFSDEQESVESVVLHKLEVDRLHTTIFWSMTETCLANRPTLMVSMGLQLITRPTR